MRIETPIATGLPGGRLGGRCRVVELSGLQRPGDLVSTEDDARRTALALEAHSMAWVPGTSSRGTGRFGYAEVHGKMGVVDIHQTRLRRGPAHALS